MRVSWTVEQSLVQSSTLVQSVLATFSWTVEQSLGAALPPWVLLGTLLGTALLRAKELSLATALPWLLATAGCCSTLAALLGTALPLGLLLATV
jgi:hypothetical protein